MAHLHKSAKVKLSAEATTSSPGKPYFGLFVSVFNFVYTHFCPSFVSPCLSGGDHLTTGSPGGGDSSSASLNLLLLPGKLNDLIPTCTVAPTWDMTTHEQVGPPPISQPGRSRKPPPPASGQLPSSLWANPAATLRPPTGEPSDNPSSRVSALSHLPSSYLPPQPLASCPRVGVSRSKRSPPLRPKGHL